MKRYFVLLMLVTMMFATGAAQAAIAEDPFEGTPGENLDEAAGGNGWGGPWTLSAGGVGAFTFVDPGMTFTGIETSSLKTIYDPTGATTTRMNRTLASAITVDSVNTEVWASALVEIGSGAGDINAGRGVGVELANAGTAVVGFGKKLNNSFGVGTAVTGTWENSSVPANTVGIRFLALQLLFNGNDTVATVYIATDGDDIDIDDPTSFTGTATITLTGSVTFDGFNIYAYHGGTTSNGVDEIRIADTYSQLITGNTATKPSPGNNASLVEIDADLAWDTPGDVTPDSYTLYFRADDPNFAAGGNIVDGDSVTPVDPTTTYELAQLDFETTYYWQVDTVAGGETFAGAVWAFTTAPATPVVSVDPISQTVAAGSEVTITIEQQNGTSFQWYQNGIAVSGATSETYVIASAQQSDEGLYTCTATNDSGSDTSEAALLMTERLVAKYEFEGNLNDTNGSADIFDGLILDPNEANAEVPDVGYDADGMGGSQALTLNTDALAGTEGYEFGAVEIPGTEDIFNFYPQGVTVSAWIKTTGSGAYMNIASKYDRDGYQGWVLNASTGGAGVFAIRAINVSQSPALLNDGLWHQVVSTYDGDMQRIYVDGLLRATQNGSPNAAGTGQPLRIGTDSVDLTTNILNIPFVGSIDDVEIFSYAMDPVSIATIYTDIAGGTICVEGDETLPGLEFDFNNDCIVDIEDFAAFAANWLNCREVPTCL